MKSKNIALSAIMTAIGFIFLFLASILPTGRLVCLCIAAASVCVVVIECGIGVGAIAGVVLVLLGWLFLPDKIAVIFSVFFAFYPVLKAIFEKIPSMVIGTVLKICLFSLLTVAVLIFGKSIGILPDRILNFIEDGKFMPTIFLGVVACFLIFDYALSRIITIYLTVIRPKINK